MKIKLLIFFTFLSILSAVPVQAGSVGANAECGKIFFQAMDQEEIELEKYYDSLETLAICVEAEAGGECYQGKQMVADVILNRANVYGGIEEAISSPGQFSSYTDGGMIRHNIPSEETYAAVASQINNVDYPGLWYFQEGGYPDYGTPYCKVGCHYFATR